MKTKMVSSNQEILAIGDRICLFSKESNGFVGLHKSSIAYNEPFVFHGQSMDLPADISNMQSILFEICICSRYKAHKQYLRVLNEKQANDDPAMKLRLQKLKESVRLEDMDNVQEMKRNIGRKIRYGETIQLKHVLSGKYLQVDPHSLSTTDKSNLKVRLTPLNGRAAQFIVIPKYKVNAEGEFVKSMKFISLETVKIRSHFLHTGRLLPKNEARHNVCDLGVGLEKSGFIVIKSSSYRKECSKLRGLDYIQMYHQDIGGMITAEGDPLGNVTEDVHIRLRPLDPMKPKTLLPSTNPNTFWQIEKENIPYSGQILTWHEQVRFRHASTRQYLCMTSDGRLGVTSNSIDPRTVFKMYPVARGDDDQVSVNSSARIEHVISGRWIKGLCDVNFVKQRLSSKQGDTMESLIWDHASCRQITIADDRRYDDAFKLILVEQEVVDDFHFIGGFVPICADLLHWISRDRDIPLKEINKIIQSVHELEEFIVVNSEPSKLRQKVLRSLRIVNVFMDVLAIPEDSMHYNEPMQRLMIEIYHTVYHYLLGSSQKNNLYLARYFDLIHRQILQSNNLGAAAVVTLTQLLKGNQAIVDRVKEHHIISVIKYLEENQNYLYLILLTEICVCQGKALSRNQNLITDEWLAQDTKGLYLINRGQFIDRTRNILYISIDNGENWEQLHEFVDSKHRIFSEIRCKFLSHQLDLFVALCKGRNQHCIRLITKDRDFINWEEAFLCLQADIMPDYMRAKFCETIVGLFVDVGTNYSVVEHSITAFDWDTIGAFQGADQFAIKDLATIFPVLRDWIYRFLTNNRVMVSVDTERNILMTNVFRLLSFLVKFGYFDDTYPIVEMIKPIMDVIDGRTDEPFRRIYDSYGLDIPLTEYEELQLDRYKESERFIISPQHRVLVQAKKAGLEVLELIMVMQVTDRIKSLTDSYKRCYEKQEDRDALDELLEPEFDPYSRKSSHIARQRQMREEVNTMFDSKKYFDVDQLQSVLLDLTLYEYDDLLQKAVSVLCRYFYSKGSVFNIVQESFIITNPESQELHVKLNREVPSLIVYIESKWSEQMLRKTRYILELLQSFCTIPGSDIPHYVNQKILANHHVIEVLLVIFDNYADVTIESPIADEVYRLALKTLRVLARDMDQVKNVLVGRFEYLIKIKRSRREVIELFCEIYSGRVDLCEQVTTRELELVFDVLREEKNRLPQVFDLLNHMCKVKSSNYAIQKNMRTVVKLLMENYRMVADVFELTPAERLQILSEPETSSQRGYYIGLIYHLSICSELNDDFMESLCRSLLPINEVLKAVCLNNISFLTKLGLVKFMSEVYLETGLSAFETGISDFFHTEKYSGYWTMMRIATEDCRILSQWVRTLSDIEIYQNMKALTYTILSEESGSLQKLAWFIDALLRMLTCVFNNVIDNVTEIDNERVTTLNQLVQETNDVIEMLGPFCADICQIEAMSGYLFAGLNCGFIKIGQINPYLQNLGSYVRKNRNPECDLINHFELEYGAELELNKKFQVFVKNCRSLYEGHNTVEMQLPTLRNKYRKCFKFKEYCPEEKVESLPLGREFQELCQTFIDKTEEEPKKCYRNLRVLIKQMKVSSTLIFQRDKDRILQEQLDVRCMQVLRGVLHNEIVALPDDWSDNINDPKIISQLRLIRSIQTVLADHHFQDSVIGHTRNPMSETFKQIIACEKAMLFNASVNVQEDMYQFFVRSTTENFFFALKTIFTVTIQELRKLKHSYEKKVETSAAEGARKKSYAMSGDAAGTMSPQEAMDEFKSQLALLKKHTESRKSKSKSVIEDGFTLCTLEMVAGMCDGQCLSLQNYLRIQDDNPKSFNIVAEICSVVSSLYYNVNGNSCDLLTQLFDTLNEICAGNQDNRVALLDNKIVDYINYILRTPEFLTCEPDQILALKEVIASVLVSMTEENDEAARTLAMNVFVLLDIESVYNVLEQFYQMSRSDTIPNLDELVRLKVPEEELVGCLPRCQAFCSRSCRRIAMGADIKEVKAEIYEIGFKYYQVLARYMDVDPMHIKATESFLTPVHHEAFRTFEKGGMAIELVKNGSLQRLYFRVKNKSIIREEIKERIKWEVDRDSSASKLRDFLGWADSIILDITYSRRVLSNFVAAFFTKFWYVWIYAQLLLSLAIVVMFVLTFKASWQLSDGWSKKTRVESVPIIQTEYLFLRPYMSILAACHTGISVCLLISFLIANHPGFANMVRLGHTISNIWRSTVLGRLCAACYRRRRKKNANTDSGASNDAGGTENGGTGSGSSGGAEGTSSIELRDEFDRLPVDNKLEVHLVSGVSCYFILSCLLSIVGTALCWFYPFGYYFFAFHLLNIIVGNQILVGVIRAITDSAFTLAWVGSLIIIIMFYFAIIGFSFLRADMDPSSGGFFCDSLGHCFVTLLRQGLVFDLWIDNFSPKHDDLKTFVKTVPTSVFTLAVYIVIFIIMLNVIMGIIVDKFAELRNLKWSREKDMLETCFICGRSSYEFETKAKGFRHHVRKEHSMWAYLHFFIYLNDTKLNDYSALALYVYRLLRKRRYDFFPMNRAMSLSLSEEDDEEAKVDEANGIVTSMLQQLDNRDKERQRYREHLRQKQWHHEHMASVSYARPPKKAVNKDFPNLHMHITAVRTFSGQIQPPPRELQSFSDDEEF